MFIGVKTSDSKRSSNIFSKTATLNLSSKSKYSSHSKSRKKEESRSEYFKRLKEKYLTEWVKLEKF